MIENPSNQNILNAIGGIGAINPQTTLSTGTASADMPANLISSVAPLQGNQNYMGTLQNFFGNNPYNMQPINMPALMGGGASRLNHAIGKNSWGSGMNMDHGAILNAMGIGNS